MRTVACDVADESRGERRRLRRPTERSAGCTSRCSRRAPAPSARCSPPTLAAWQATLDTNLTGAFLGIKHAGAAIAASGGGAIVAISSIAGPLTHRFMSAYCVSKAGLETLVRNAADELGIAKVRVNAVQPGLVPTDLARRS